LEAVHVASIRNRQTQRPQPHRDSLLRGLRAAEAGSAQLRAVSPVRRSGVAGSGPDLPLPLGGYERERYPAFVSVAGKRSRRFVKAPASRTGKGNRGVAST